MPKYKKCPRCELNYIEESKEYCDVCLAELQGGKLRFADLDDEEEEEKTELCPVCNENYMLPGEKMCEACKKNAEYEEEAPGEEKDEEWRNYLDEETDEFPLESEGIDFGEDLSEEDFEDGFEDEEEYEENNSDEDDFEYVGDLGDDYEDEDEEDEEDEDEDF